MYRVVAKTAKGRILVGGKAEHKTEEEAAAAIPAEKMRLISGAARNPMIVEDDDGFADDLYDVLRREGVQFVAAEIPRRIA